ncbi:MAG: phosphate transport system protein [Cycloclasticus pugetii]|jgi:phosphate transport system protein|uniref:Phosphate-specific transport system accessory protein PhoU n=1 Tax=Cycloclasticus pugetii TaxID=34068 RepID=A0AB33YZG6_9GAMM|nr:MULTISPECIES: phosphate signaling complex protein PhoU [Cycloclasticus]ATI04075.1 phosphate transport system regulatory protein PhoU [Cycloclasticus sp. PY97N]EPD12297.1 phosphate transport system protein PhoU [Cycloclasticus pugetii]|tara:strand:+ start:8377 stop:9075 length:699 start_codon:yes stop_codon:yes gene_type:complete
MTTGEHISHKFDEDVEEVTTSVLNMGGLVVQQIEKSVKALLAGDKEMAEEVIEDDLKVNTFDVDIDEMCNSIIVMRQPTATDLRLIMAIIKTTSDLERMGDEAKRIARQAIDISKRGAFPEQFDSIEQMSTRVIGMLNKALDAFARRDVDESFNVIQVDKKVDKDYENLVRQQITYMMEDPRKIPVAIDLLWSSRALERIGDRACNICEYVIYLVKGKDVRHVEVKELEKHL